jgi:hypothetical protein
MLINFHFVKKWHSIYANFSIGYTKFIRKFYTSYFFTTFLASI